MRAGVALLFMLPGFAVAGCGGGGDPSSTRQPSPAVKPRSAEQPLRAESAWDDCAGKLQNLCGQLFFYYSQKRSLPQSLQELAAFPGPHPNVPLTCPESKQPYAYTPDSHRTIGSYGRIVIHDSQPSHSGHRWVVAVREVPGPQLIAEVVRVPESIFALPPQPPP